MQGNDYIIANFRDVFSAYKDKKIAIYGTGITAQAIIENFQDYNIIGLIDPMKTGQIFWGKQVLDLKEVLEQEVFAIILAARAASIKIIYARIWEECKQYGVPILDMNGTDLIRKFEVEGVAENKPVECESCALELKKLIDEHDVVSFDIFDTLLMRKTLAPSDIFVEMVWKDSNVPKNFPQERVRAEELLNQIMCPRYEDIYEKLQQSMNLTDEEKIRLMQLEMEVELENLICREEMVHCYEYAKEQGKDIYIVSDMYYGKEILSQWLKALGISGFIDLLVSCDYGVNKDNGLFRQLQGVLKGRSCLHIGDNENADTVAARKAGIDAFHILRGAELIQFSAHKGLMTMMKANYANKRVLGRHIAELLNSPFAMYGQNRPSVRSAYKLGKILLGPVVTKYMLWLFRELRKEEMDCLIFPLRDGYLFEKLYQHAIQKSVMRWPEAVTIEASRKACSLAGLQDEEDIKDILMVMFNDSPDKLLKIRFELENENILEYQNESKEEYVLKHSSLILKKAKENRERYLKYFTELRIESDKKIAFFEFISRGTSQRYLEKILGSHMKGYYWASIDHSKDNLSKLCIETLYPTKTLYQDDQSLFEYQLWLESIFSAYTPSFFGFTEKQEKKYYPETRSMEEIQKLQEIHRGIIDYWKEYVGGIAIENLLEQEEMDLDFVDQILGCVSSRKTQIAQELQAIKLVDEYCSITHESDIL